MGDNKPTRGHAKNSWVLDEGITGRLELVLAGFLEAMSELSLKGQAEVSLGGGGGRQERDGAPGADSAWPKAWRQEKLRVCKEQCSWSIKLERGRTWQWRAWWAWCDKWKVLLNPGSKRVFNRSECQV